MEANKSFKLGNAQIPLTLSPIFILPEEKRPFLSQVDNLSVPIIDLKYDNNHHEIVKNISKACEEYGFFQIINHGIDDKLCQDMINAVFRFFNLPPEDRSALYSDDLTKRVKVYNYHLKVGGENEKVNMWSESLGHPWDGLNDDFTELLPGNPPEYRYFCKFLFPVMGRN